MMRYFQIFILVFIFIGCGDDGGQLTEFSVRVTASDDNAPLEGVRVQLRQSGAVVIINRDEHFFDEYPMFITNNQGTTQGHFFTDQGSLSVLRIAALDVDEPDCYPNRLLVEGMTNSVSINALRKNAKLRLELSNYQPQTNIDQVRLLLTHKPNDQGGDCNAILFDDIIDLNNTSTFELPIYPFGDYTLEIGTRSFGVFDFISFSPSQSDTLVVITP